MIWERRMKARLKKAAIRRRVRAARKTMAAVCYGIIECDDDIYNYDRDTEQWEIMKNRLEDIGSDIKAIVAQAYQIGFSAGCYRWKEGQYRKMRKRENEFHW